MLTKAHQLDDVAKEHGYTFKTIKVITGNLRGEFYKQSEETPNVILVLYNSKNLNNLNLEKHFKFPTQLQKVLRSYPEIKRKIGERALKEDAIEQAEHLVKEWNRVKKSWINRYFYGNRRVLRDLIQLQNNQSQENMQELDNKVNKKESDKINEEKAKGSKPSNHINLLKRPAADNNHSVKLQGHPVSDMKQRLEVQPVAENNATNDVHDKPEEESAHQSENMEQEVHAHNNKHDRESVGALTTAANSDGSHNIQNEHLPSEAENYGGLKKTGFTSVLGKIVIRKKCPSSKPEVLPKASQIQSVAKELGFVFDITWGENGKPRGEFYRKTGKPDAMLVFYNFIRYGLLTLQKFYKFPSNHQKLLQSYPEVQRRVTSHALPQDALEKGKDLDVAWNQIWKTWKKTYSPWGYDIITTAKQIIENRSPFLRPANIITHPNQNATPTTMRTEALLPTAKHRNKEKEAPHHNILNQFQNEEVQSKAISSQVCGSPYGMKERQTEKSTLAITYVKNTMIDETGNIKDILAEVSMPKLISPLPPTPEGEVSCFEEESGQLYFPTQNPDIATNSEMENVVLAFDLNML